MIAAQLVLLPLLLLFTWGYLAMRPASRRRSAINLFDAAVIVLAIVSSIAAGWWVAGLRHQPEGSVWVTVMSTVTTFHVFPAVLLAGWYVRKRVFG